MKKFLMLAAVFGVTVYAANKLMASPSSPSSEMKDDLDKGQNELKGKFEKLGESVKEKLALAEDKLKNADDKAKGELQKVVDSLKKQGKEVQKGADRIGADAKENWSTVKKELSEVADRVEKDLKK